MALGSLVSYGLIHVILDAVGLKDRKSNPPLGRADNKADSGKPISTASAALSTAITIQRSAVSTGDTSSLYLLQRS